MFRFLISDKQGNSPFLHAAQPRTAEDRANALAQLQTQINLGTLRIENEANKPQQNALAATLPKAMGDVHFEELSFSEFPDGALITLGVSKAHVIQTLTAMRENIHVRERVAGSIFDAIMYGLITVPPEGQALLDNYMQKTLLLESTIIETEGKAALDALLAWCATLPVFDYYFNALTTTANVAPHDCVLFYAEIKNLHLYIWQRDEDNTLKLLGYNLVETTQNACHLFYTNKRPEGGIEKHYNLLLKSPTLTYQPKKVTLSRDFLNEKNQYGHNALHRGVRSVAADAIVPFLLNVLNFKSKVNEQDMYGTTALHRAVKYYAESRENITQILAKEGKGITFGQYVLGVFRCLIAAGADLSTLRDKDQHTVLDRAKHHNAAYQGQDGNFNLSQKLLEMKQLQTPAATIPKRPVETATLPAPKQPAKRGRPKNTVAAPVSNPVRTPAQTINPNLTLLPPPAPRPVNTPTNSDDFNQWALDNLFTP